MYLKFCSERYLDRWLPVSMCIPTGYFRLVRSPPSLPQICVSFSSLSSLVSLSLSLSLSLSSSPCRLSISLHSTSLCSSSLIAVSSPAAFVGASNGPCLVWFDALSAEKRAVSFRFVHLCCNRHRRAPVFLHRSVVAGSICRRFQQSKSHLSLAPWAAAIRDFLVPGSFILRASERVCVCVCVRARARVRVRVSLSDS